MSQMFAFCQLCEKIKHILPQKVMSNRYQQTKNLDGAFLVKKRKAFKTSLFLVDDVVDSGWTLTVITALLRQAGSGPVFPVTLAKMLSTK